MATTKKATAPKSPRTRKPSTNGKQVNRDATTSKLAQMKLLGNIVTFGSRSGTTHQHRDVVQALTDAGLNSEVAREFRPAQAFSRACKKLSEERVIDVLREDKDNIVFQFTKKTMESVQDEREWKYAKETLLSLDKSTGKIACNIPELEQLAQSELDKHMEQRSTNDISQIVHRLFSKEADLFPLPGAIGVFFVPQEHHTFLAKIESFLGKLGRKPYSFPVPSGVGEAEANITESIGEAFDKLISDHETAIESFSIHTRKDTLAGAAEKINTTRVKIEAYANYLGDKQADLLASVERANAHLAQVVEKLVGEREAIPEDSRVEGGGVRNTLFGSPVTAVLRTLGARGVSKEDAAKIVEGEGLHVSPHTVNTQIRWGKTGYGGHYLAELTDEQMTQLMSHTKN